jgi:hypothetical protein
VTTLVVAARLKDYSPRVMPAIVGIVPIKLCICA